MNEKELLENLDSMSVDEILDVVNSPDNSLSEELQIKALERAAHLTTLSLIERGELKRIEEVYQDFLESEAGDDL